MKKFIFIILYAYLGLLKVPNSLAELADKQGNAIVINKLQGSYSNIYEREFLKISSEKEWIDLWKRHSNDILSRSVIDFDKNMLIAIFFGRCSIGFCSHIKNIAEDDKAITIFIDYAHIQIIGPTINTSKGESSTEFENIRPSVTPYAILVLPKSSKKVVIKNNVQHKKTEPIWETVKEF